MAEDYIKPFSDIFIKYLFGKEENKKILIDFINDVLVDEDFPKIISVEIKNPFNPKKFPIDKESYLDLKVIDENKKQYNIEIQSSPEVSFMNRILYYWSQLYTSQISEGEDYNKLRQTTSINVLNFRFIKDNEYFHNLAYLTLKCNPKIALTNLIFIHFIELPKFISNKSISEMTGLERWLYFFLNEGKEGVNMEVLIKDDEELSQAHKEYERFTQDEELRELYWMRVEGQRLIMTQKEEAYQEGREEGRQEGREEGRQEGEYKKAVETAKKLKTKGMTISEIAEITGLTEAEIKNL